MDVGTKESRKRLSEILDRVARARGLPDLSGFRAGIKTRGKATSRLVIEERRKTRY